LQYNNVLDDQLISGTINIHGVSFILSQSVTISTFTNTGSINIGTTLISYTTLFRSAYNSGSIGGAGLLFLTSTVATFTPNFDNSVTALALNSTTLNGPGTITNLATHTLAMTNSAVNATLINQGVLLVLVNSSISGVF